MKIIHQLIYRNLSVAYFKYEEQNQNLVYLRSCYVDPKYRGLGIASWLMLECLKSIKNVTAFGYILKNNEIMIHIFEKFDFKKIKWNWEVFGSFLYSKKIDEFISDDYQVNINVPTPRIYKFHQEKNKTQIIRSHYYI